MWGWLPDPLKTARGDCARRPPPAARSGAASFFFSGRHSEKNIFFKSCFPLRLFTFAFALAPFLKVCVWGGGTNVTG